MRKIYANLLLFKKGEGQKHPEILEKVEKAGAKLAKTLLLVNSVKNILAR